MRITLLTSREPVLQCFKGTYDLRLGIQAFEMYELSMSCCFSILLLVEPPANLKYHFI